MDKRGIKMGYSDEWEEAERQLRIEEKKNYLRQGGGGSGGLWVFVNIPYFIIYFCLFMNPSCFAWCTQHIVLLIILSVIYFVVALILLSCVFQPWDYTFSMRIWIVAWIVAVVLAGIDLFPIVKAIFG